MTKVRELEHAIERLADDMEAASDGEEEPPAPSPSTAGPSTSAPSTAPETPTPSPAAPPATAGSGAPTGGAGKRRSRQTRASPKLRLPGARGYAFKRTVVAEFNRIKQGSRLSRDRLERIRTAAQVEAKRALADADEKSGNYLRPGGDFAGVSRSRRALCRVDWPMQPALSQEGTWLTHRAARARQLRRFAKRCAALCFLVWCTRQDTLCLYI